MSCLDVKYGCWKVSPSKLGCEMPWRKLSGTGNNRPFFLVQYELSTLQAVMSQLGTVVYSPLHVLCWMIGTTNSRHHQPVYIIQSMDLLSISLWMTPSLMSHVGTGAEQASTHDQGVGWAQSVWQQRRQGLYRLGRSCASTCITSSSTITSTTCISSRSGFLLYFISLYFTLLTFNSLYFTYNEWQAHQKK